MRSLPLILTLGIALRLIGANHPLWLDEIWSYDIARRLSSPLGVLTDAAARIDNNHPLNTLWLYALPTTAPFWLFHLPSTLAGIASLPLLALIAARRGRAAMLWATTLAAVSLPLVQYSHEARGYALATFFALVMFDAQERYLARPRWAWVTLFAAATTLGALSHVLIVHVYAGLLATAVLWGWLHRSRANAWHVARLHALPVMLLMTYFALFVRRLDIGGAPPVPMPGNLIESLGTLFGGLAFFSLEDRVVAHVDVVTVLAAGFGIISLALAFADLWRRRSPLCAFVIIGCVVSPAAVIIRQALRLEQPQPLAARYFLPLLPIVFVLVANGAHRSKWVKPILGLLVFINTSSTLRTLLFDRDPFGPIVQLIGEVGPQPARVLADHPMRTRMTLQFFADRQPPLRRPIVLLPIKPFSNEAKQATWLVMQGTGSAPPQLDLGLDVMFVKVRQYASPSLSNFPVALYCAEPLARSLGAARTPPTRPSAP